MTSGLNVLICSTTHCTSGSLAGKTPWVSAGGILPVILRQILPGAADKSYGIQVARPAGLPDSIIDRTKDILSGLKGGEASEEKVSPPSKKKRSRAKVKEEAAEDDHQMTLFG